MNSNLGDKVFPEDTPNGKDRKLMKTARFQLIRFTRSFDEFLSNNPAALVKSCITCDHFNEQKEECGKVGKRPPARIIAFGCEMFDNIDDEIPF